jgi:hypothetical protein
VVVDNVTDCPELGTGSIRNDRSWPNLRSHGRRPQRLLTKGYTRRRSDTADHRLLRQYAAFGRSATLASGLEATSCQSKKWAAVYDPKRKRRFVGIAQTCPRGGLPTAAVHVGTAREERAFALLGFKELTSPPTATRTDAKPSVRALTR